MTKTVKMTISDGTKQIKLEKLNLKASLASGYVLANFGFEYNVKNLIRPRAEFQKKRNF